MAAKQRSPAAIGLAGKGGKKGGPARAARLTPEKRSENARKPVSARGPKSGNGSPGDARESTPANSRLSTSKQALHIRLKRLKNAKDESEVRRLTDELQRIVFHKQYRNAEN
jgi:hypothetical protein